ncbi:hypothetical protein SAMN02745166_00244 [Prosthecobacter debontii]|uniref:Uncharacterized protein n=2 Tax=Prosthecobacter debontii TaxID=48467 RepID=A0A1T4WHF4_9BACT|nr:hypothetical protein SAMN02745166_00244 [Prosthecobacter debontii]
MLISWSFAADSGFQAATCEGIYKRHVQGICTDAQDAIYWSWTDAIVKTDRQGHILRQVQAPDHQGDLCHVEGKLYVAVNLGKFNQPAGAADSWVFVYDSDSLAELARYPVPEVVHGAGGMAYRNGHFYIVGGLPPGADGNEVYEYDASFKLVKRHALASGYTLMGIQTVEYAEGAWWFGCYGKPAVLLRADEAFQMTGRWEINASVGIATLGQGRFLIAENLVGPDKRNTARVKLARADAQQGLIFEAPIPASP